MNKLKIGLNQDKFGFCWCCGREGPEGGSIIVTFCTPCTELLLSEAKKTFGEEEKPNAVDLQERAWQVWESLFRRAA